MGQILRIVATVILLVGYTAHSQVWLVSKTIPSHGLHVKSGGGDSSILSVDTTVVTMAVYNAGAEKSIVIDTLRMLITDVDNSKGPVMAGDYSTVTTARSVTDKEWQGTHLGYQNLDAIVYGPSDAEHGYVLVWDTSEVDRYNLNAVTSVASAAGMIIEAMDTVLYSNTSQTTIISLPVAAVIHDIYVYVVTTFNGSGTDQLDIGITGSEDRYESNLDVAVGAGFPAMSLTNIRDHMAATTNITFDYDDQNSNASEGMLKVYVQYSIQ